jgi:hypothetical protein
MRLRVSLLIAAASVATAATAYAQDPARSAQAVQAFEKVRVVLQHPRCQNCHIPGDAPLQYDQGIAHAMNVKRGADGRGSPALECAGCHQTRNLPAEYGVRSPPGAPNWHLPPANMKMVFIGLTSAELCRVLKSPQSNGGKTAAQLVEHVAEDKLVLWGWAPGGNRAPVSVPHAEFVAAFKDWVAGGMPCPGR